MFRRIARSLKNALWFIAFITASAAAQGHDEGRIVVFGDSLSDTGNVFATTGQLNVPPYDQLDPFRIPDDPYAAGFGRFTNGLTWVEVAAREVGAGRDTRAALRWRRPGSNYAFGGARAGAPLIANNARHLTDQVTEYLADVNGAVGAQDVIVLFIGANDVADAVRVLAFDPTGATSIDGLLQGIGSVNANLAALAAAGARNFVILNVPNVALVPALNPPLAPTGLGGIATCWTVLFNLGTPLPPGCPALPPGIPGLDDVAAALAPLGGYVKVVDTFTFINRVAADPRSFGITNVTDTCVKPNAPPYQCARPDQYFFWDGIHPTRAIHRLLAREVLRQAGAD